VSLHGKGPARVTACLQLSSTGIQRQGRDPPVRTHPKPLALHPNPVLRLAPAPGTLPLSSPIPKHPKLTSPPQDRRRPHNGDGFGIGYYTCPSLGPEPCVFTSTIPAWNCINLSRIASKTTSSLIFAHVRATTEGNLSDSNCHPFSYKSLMFMHNGGIGSFRQIKRRLALSLNEQWFSLVQGSTDSEWAFATFLDCLDKAGVDLGAEMGKGGFGHTVLRKAILKTIERINACIKEVVGTQGMGSEESRSLLNFAVTDGESVVCTRYVSSKTDEAASLFFSSGTSWKELTPGGGSGKGGEAADRDYVMERRDKGSDIVLVASEPLTFERGKSTSPIPPYLTPSLFPLLSPTFPFLLS
jgi:glutamine amidotransferase